MNMNWITIGGGILGMCILMSVPGVAQQEYSVVYDLNYQLTLHPDHGDQLIQQNTAAFNSRFYSCLSVVRQRAAQAARQHTDMCNRHADPHNRARCEATNEGAKIHRWTNEIQAVCQGKMLWSQTATGMASMTGKRALESVRPGEYERIVRTQLPQWRAFYVCE